MLKGYKTYIAGAIAIVTALGGWLDGDLSIAAALQLAVPAILAMALRAGVDHQGQMTRDHIERLTTDALNSAQLGDGK